MYYEIHKTNQMITIDDEPPLRLYAFVDECGNTMIQVLGERKVKLVKKYLDNE